MFSIFFPKEFVEGKYLVAEQHRTIDLRRCIFVKPSMPQNINNCYWESLMGVTRQETYSNEGKNRAPGITCG